MYNENLIIVGYDFGYNYNTYYVDRKNKNQSFPSDLNIARSINLSVSTDSDLGQYDVSDVTVTTNKVEGNRVVTEYYSLKLVKIFTNYKCRKTDVGGNTTTTYVKPRIFYPMCNKVNVQCSSTRGAVVSSLTVCNQNLY
jgi:hypothetical protein